MQSRNVNLWRSKGRSCNEIPDTWAIYRAPAPNSFGVTCFDTHTARSSSGTYSNDKEIRAMAPSTSGRRRLSLDLIQRAVTDISLEVQGVSKYMDLRLPHHASTLNVVSKVECECCGLFEDCTGAYVRRVRDRFCGRWVCGLCSEAVKEEVVRHVTREDALSAHMEVCRRFNRTVRANPALSLASAMTEILKKSSRRGREACKVNRSYSAV